MDGIKIASRTLSETAALRICEYDACGQRMAGCLGDNTLAVFDRTGGHSLWECSSSWRAGSARVTQVAWAHAEFGQLLAVGSDGGEVSIYEERGVPVSSSGGGDDGDQEDASSWQLRVRSHDAASSISDLRFGPKQLGLCLAVAYCDGYVRLYKSPDVLAPRSLLLDNDFVAGAGGAACVLAWRHWTPGVAPALLVAPFHRYLS